MAPAVTSPTCTSVPAHLDMKGSTVTKVCLFYIIKSPLFNSLSQHALMSKLFLDNVKPVNPWCIKSIHYIHIYFVSIVTEEAFNACQWNLVHVSVGTGLRSEKIVNNLHRLLSICATAQCMQWTVTRMTFIILFTESKRTRLFYKDLVTELFTKISSLNCFHSLMHQH